MNRFPIPVVLVGFYIASACATVCRTPCGLAVPSGDCKALQHYEGRVTQRLAQAVPAWSDAKICAALEGYTVRIRPHDDVLDRGCGVDAWRDEWKRCVIGLTDTKLKVITLSNGKWETSAFAHEVAHVAGTLTADRLHCRWADPWFVSAISDLQGQSEWQTAEPECSR